MDFFWEADEAYIHDTQGVRIKDKYIVAFCDKTDSESNDNWTGVGFTIALDRT